MEDGWVAAEGRRQRGSGSRWKTTYAVLDVNVGSVILHLLVFYQEVFDIHVGKLVEFFVSDLGGLGALEIVGGRGPGEVLTGRERASESWLSVEAVGL